MAHLNDVDPHLRSPHTCGMYVADFSLALIGLQACKCIFAGRGYNYRLYRTSELVTGIAVWIEWLSWRLTDLVKAQPCKHKFATYIARCPYRQKYTYGPIDYKMLIASDPERYASRW
jgi:hypothetical protein